MTKSKFATVSKKKTVDKKLAYIVVQEIGKELFEKMVNEWITKGYECIGGCDCKSVSANPQGWIFTQALIKE